MTKLKNKIMRRVYVVYTLRKLLSPFALKAYTLLAVSLWSLAQVSLVDVFTNTQGFAGAPSLYRFYSSAFLNTEIVIQISIVAVSLLALWLAVDVVRKTTYEHNTALS